MKKLICLAMSLIMVVALCACGSTASTQPAQQSSTGGSADSDLAYVKANGKLVIGYTVYEPMNYTDANGNFTGFDTELAQAVCEKLGVKPDFVEINWDTKEVELNAKSIDCIWNGLTITPERQENMAITDPYVKNAQVVVMKKDAAYTDTSSLVGKTVVAEMSSAGEEAIQGDANLSKANYVSKNVQTDCLMEVKAGTADAAVIDMTLAHAMIGDGTNYSDLAIKDYLAVENYGVAFRKGSDICTAVNEIFKQMVADGSMKKLADKYGLELSSSN